MQDREEDQIDLEEIEQTLLEMGQRLITVFTADGCESFAFPLDDGVECIVPFTPGIRSIVGADGAVLWEAAA